MEKISPALKEELIKGFTVLKNRAESIAANYKSKALKESILQIAGRAQLEIDRINAAEVITEPPIPTPMEAKLLWEDDFNGPANSSPNSSIWNYRTGGRWENNTIDATFTSRPENVRLDGQSNLVITARKEQMAFGDGVVKPYTSARIDTSAKRTLLTGYVSCKAKIQTTAGSWPAFFTLGGVMFDNSWPRSGEIDLFEVFGASKTPVHHIHIVGADDGKSAQLVPTMDTEYHEYGVEIVGTEYIEFYVDRKSTFKINRKGEWPFGTIPQYFTFFINVGSWGGNPEQGNWPVSMTIDWIKAWDKRPF